MPYSSQIPRTVELYLLDISTEQCRQRLRQEFYKNSHIRDPRVIDLLVIKVLISYVEHFLKSLLGQI